jgi:hypothetical protein
VAGKLQPPRFFKYVVKEFWLYHEMEKYIVNKNLEKLTMTIPTQPSKSILFANMDSQPNDSKQLYRDFYGCSLRDEII